MFDIDGVADDGAPAFAAWSLLQPVIMASIAHKNRNLMLPLLQEQHGPACVRVNGSVLLHGIAVGVEERHLAEVELADAALDLGAVAHHHPDHPIGMQ